ncbi:hypothetical protein Gotur_016362 [Gossypium turneri]
MSCYSCIFMVCHEDDSIIGEFLEAVTVYRKVATATTMGGVPTDNVDFVVTLDAESRSSSE